MESLWIWLLKIIFNKRLVSLYSFLSLSSSVASFLTPFAVAPTPLAASLTVEVAALTPKLATPSTTATAVQPVSNKTNVEGISSFLIVFMLIEALQIFLDYLYFDNG